MDKNDEEVGKEFERLINEMEKYSVKDGRKLNDEYRKVRDERPVEDDGSMPEHERAAMGDDLRRAADADLYDMGYEDGYHDGKADMMDELEDKLAEGRDGAVDDGEISEEDYKAFMAERARIFGEDGRDGGASGTDAGGGRGGAGGGGSTDTGGQRGGAGGGGLGGRWKSFAGNNPNSSQWLRTVAASLVATTLGILITFGTKSCETDIAERRADRQATIDVLYNLDKKIKQMQGDVKQMEGKDSVMQLMLDFDIAKAKARIKKTPLDITAEDMAEMKKTAETFVNGLTQINFAMYDTSTEQRFMTSDNMPKAFGDRELRSILAHFYTLELSTINKLRTLNERSMAIMAMMLADERRFETGSAEKYAYVLIKDESIRRYVTEHHLALLQAKMCMETLRQLYDQIRQKTGIKADEIKQESMFDDLKIDAHVTDSTDNYRQNNDIHDYDRYQSSSEEVRRLGTVHSFGHDVRR